MEPKTIEDVLALINERPADAELFQLLGQLYLKAGKFDEAREAYDRSLALDPNDPWTHLYMGNWFFFVGDRRKALEEFQHAADLMPDEAIVYTCQGDIYKAQRQHELAEQAYKTAVRVAPDDLQAKRKLSEWYAFRYGGS